MGKRMLGLMGALALVACGGKVVIDAGDGSGGVGGSSSSSSSNGSSSSSTGTGMGGGDAQALCDKACEKMSSVPGCAQPECAAICIAQYQKAGACQPLFLDVAACVAENAGVGKTCTGQPCEDIRAKYEACMNGATCSTGACSVAPDGSCSCGGSCNGVDVSASCAPSGNGAVACVCNVGDTQVGQCVSIGGPGLSCDIVTGCCSGYF